ESVAWVSSQCDLLAAIFVVTALVLARERPAWAIAATVFALLSKESALPLVGLLLLARLGCFGETLRTRRSVVVASAIATLLYMGARQTVLSHGFSLTRAGLSQVDATLAQRL